MREPGIGGLIKQLDSALAKEANNALRGLGLTTTQVRVLMEFRDAPDRRLSMKSLEKRLHVAQPTVAGLVRRLREKGFVTTEVDPKDARIKVVTLTQRGLECAQEADAHIVQTEARLLAGFTDEERAMLQNMLHKVVQNIYGE